MDSDTTENTFDRDALNKTLTLILESWKKGEYLTPKTTFHSNYPVMPASYQYTKPVVLLADEMSGSGGDAFPGLMQGNGRVKVVGNRTMGLGGHVEEIPGLYNSGLKLRMTKSMFFRPDGVAVENNGVQPDITYIPNRDDFMYEFKGYQKFYLNELFKLMDKN
jgi:C-terminal processing protease CtpA/Prc